jgi:hypothetical protein
MKRIEPVASYPSPAHHTAAEAAAHFLSSDPNVDAVLLTCSCARGKATKDSCVDIAVLLPGDLASEKKDHLENSWGRYYQQEQIFTDLRAVGAYSHIDLHLFDGKFEPSGHGWTTGPDGFELEIGNLVAYPVPLFERNDHFQKLRDRWLPYYSEDLRQQRLAMILQYCRNNLDHIPVYVARRLFFQAFDRLYNAFGEFLQALFVSARIYPIAYDKWIQEQIVEILELPELYRRLPSLFEIRRFESEELSAKGQELSRIVAEYVE